MLKMETSKNGKGQGIPFQLRCLFYVATQKRKMIYSNRTVSALGCGNNFGTFDSRCALFWNHYNLGIIENKRE